MCTTLTHALTVNTARRGIPKKFFTGTWLAEVRSLGPTRPHTSGLPNRYGPGAVDVSCSPFTHARTRSLTRTHAIRHACTSTALHSLYTLSLTLAHMNTVACIRGLVDGLSSSSPGFAGSLRSLKPTYPPWSPVGPPPMSQRVRPGPPPGRKGLGVHGSVEAQRASTRCRSKSSLPHPEQPPPPILPPKRDACASYDIPCFMHS